MFPEPDVPGAPEPDVPGALFPEPDVPAALFPEPEVPVALCSRSSLLPERGLRFRVGAHCRSLNHAGVLCDGLNSTCPFIVDKSLPAKRHRHTWFPLHLPVSLSNPSLTNKNKNPEKKVESSGNVERASVYPHPTP